jgi:hypothetical protein
VFGDLIHAAQNDRFAKGTTLAARVVGQHLFGAAFLLALWICSFTEFNPARGTTGFPHRLFVLPITSFRLVLVPMAVGVIGMELVCGALLLIRERGGESLAPYALLLGVYMVLHQTVLWTVNLRAGRVLVLGVLAVSFIMLPMLRFLLIPYSETTLTAVLVGAALSGFLFSWASISRQRSGGGSAARWWASMTAGLADPLPRRQQKSFDSPHAAQFWFEWRRSGTVLPSLVAGLLVFVIAPLSWYLRDSPGDSFRILVVILVMPVGLAMPVGKAFSKPDFWSADLAVPPILAVRPLTTTDIVVTKLRVAARSTAMTWGVVIAFLALWLPLWANLDAIRLAKDMVRRHYSNSEYAPYAIALLLILAGIFLTWRFLVSNLWLGLAGNRTLFAVSALPYGVLTPIGLVMFLVFLRDETSWFGWLQQNLNRLLPDLVWITAIGFFLKLALSFVSWRRVRHGSAFQYLCFWVGSTALMVILAVLLSGAVQPFLNADSSRLQTALVLAALLVVPLGRLALAPIFLARNRHR